jgi:hypothetical protein
MASTAIRRGTQTRNARGRPDASPRSFLERERNLLGRTWVALPGRQAQDCAALMSQP